ncbi:MAG: RNA polymerase sigma factor region1.1 domain-containing protein [Solirubrobacterales bacterium]
MATTVKTGGLLADEAPVWERKELQKLISDGQEKGFLTVAQVAGALEEVEVSREQVSELHGRFEELGIDLVAAEGEGADGQGPPMTEGAPRGRGAQG